MKDSLLKDDLIDYLNEEYTIEESKEQLDNAKVKIINLVEITYSNGVKEIVCRDINDNFVKYK